MKYCKHLLAAFILCIATLISRADEGMWLPLFLEQMNEKDMKAQGMKISAKDIYDINKGSLKDAIVSFGGFCTGEVISGQGLVLTNHHCGFDAIQNNSTLDHNYIRDGFWAMNSGQEIPVPGLFVTFIVRIDDVSKLVLNGINSSISETERQSIIDKNIAELRKNVKREAHQESFIRSFFEGNQYFLFVTETYRDVRLAGAPPSAIGNFGKDTDNWMWPRHTGDFSMFRIYAGAGNKPAEYAADNKPYVPKKSLSISLDGVAEDDFTMVFGFPGRTNQYLHSAAVAQIMNVNDPAKISIREKALAVIDGFMRKDEQIKIQYASKYAGIQNSYKKWQGEVLGLSNTNAVAKKQAYEEEFQKRVNANPEWKAKYGTLLDDLTKAYKDIEKYGRARDYYVESLTRVEAQAITAQYNSLRSVKDGNGEAAFKAALPKAIDRLEELYKEYNPTVDKQLFIALIKKFKEEQSAEFIAPYLADKINEFKGDYTALADDLYTNVDILQNGAKVIGMLEKSADAVFAANDMSHANQLFLELGNHYSKSVSKNLSGLQNKINQLNRSYMQAQMEVMKEKKFYPDANSTLRVTYGKVKGYNPRDGVGYDYYTYMEGIMDKYKAGDYEFDVPEKLRSLYKSKDFGPYKAKNGKMPVCFIARNHTTGGNSGSPALDAYGNLVGLNFDRAWEGTMSDINYDPSICRNIMVDIRYILFVVDKYAGASHLVKEMKLVHPKGGK
jgi:Peptidase S46